MLFGSKREAKVKFGDNEMKVVTEGDFVRCAVTGQPIPVGDLKYWNVERQEAYASAEISMKRYIDLRSKKA